MKLITLPSVAVVVFALWGVILSGSLSGIVGSPGIIQSMRLKALLESKQVQARALEDEVRNLKIESALLEKSSILQEREVRRVLGYAASDEIIFDFSHPDRMN